MARTLPRLLLGAAVAILSAYSVVLTQSAPAPLFTPLPAGRQMPDAAPFAGDAAIVREELVGMDLGALFDSAGVAGPAPRITLNVFDKLFVGVFERLDLSAQGYRSWVGALEGMPNSYVVLTEGNGVVSGQFTTPADVYQVQTVAPGVHQMRQVIAAREIRSDERVVDAPTETPASSHLERRGTDDGSQIDVLLLYTPRAQTALGGPAQVQGYATRIETETNTAFQHSGVTTRVRVVAVQPLDASDLMSDGSLNELLLSAEAGRMRDDTGADLVQLLASHPANVPATSEATCGQAPTLTDLRADQSPSAYSMADVHPVCRASFTPTHELGHSMGSHHAREDYSNVPPSVFPYSFGYKSPGLFRTVMAYECENRCPPILAFSSPNKLHNRLLTGTSEVNNALTIENTAYTVANFRPSVMRYRMTQLPGQSGVSATSVNSAGDLAGLLTVPWYAEAPGFSTTGGASTVHSVGSVYTGRIRLNDRGQIALTRYIAARPSVAARTTVLFWDGVRWQDLQGGGPGNAVGERFSADLNNSGQIVLFEYRRDPIGNLQVPVVLWSAGSMRDLGYGSYTAGAASINDHGHVCGTRETPVPGTTNVNYVAVYWNGTALTEIGTAGGHPYLCSGLNNLGHSVGTTSNGSAYSAYLWTGTTFRPLGDLGGGASSAAAVNDRDEVVGASFTIAGGRSEWFLWREGVMSNLTNLVNWPEPGWNSGAISDINNAGQIAGGIYRINEHRVVRLDPLGSGAGLPLPPTDLRESVTGNTVQLSWTPPARDGAYVYRIEAGSVDGWADIGAFTVGGSSVTISGVPNGTYYVRVRTIEGLAISYADHAIPVRVGPLPPQPPQSLRAIALGTAVSFAWDPPAGGYAPTGYLLEAGLAPGTTNFDRVPVVGTSFSVSGVPPNTYYVRVTATNDGGISGPSNEVTVVVRPLLPDAPRNLAASRTGNRVTLTWAAPATGGAATGYQLEAGSAPALDNLGAWPIPGLSATATVPPGTYFVRVRGVNAVGTGPPSSEIIVTVP